MSINWVMLDASKGFIHLPNEKRIWTSPPRTSLSITTPRSYPGNNPINIQNSAGTLYLTNQRIVYLPSPPTANLQSFSAPLLNLHDTHVSAPFFGPNVWHAVLQPVPGGGILSSNPSSSASQIEVKLTFKEGGAYDFHTTFERIRERLAQVVEEARARNLTDPSAAAAGQPIDLSQVHLEELPAYEPGSGSNAAMQTTSLPPPPQHQQQQQQQQQQPPPSSEQQQQPPPPPDSASHPPPDEPPPGYEETQRQSVAEELERRLSAGEL